MPVQIRDVEDVVGDAAVFDVEERVGDGIQFGRYPTGPHVSLVLKNLELTSYSHSHTYISGESRQHVSLQKQKKNVNNRGIFSL
jgi:hypothetical protein